MAKYVLMDFETRSRANLLKVGAWAYSRDPSTEILCLGYTIDGQDPQLWLPDFFGCPNDLSWAFREGIPIWAHNAAFERAIYENVLLLRYNKDPDHPWPEIWDKQWCDTAATCAYKSLPLKLEKVGAVLDLSETKSMAGNKNLKSLMKPKKDGTWDNDPVKHALNQEYCLQDIRAEDALLRRVGPLPAPERRLWILDQVINNRGVKIDRELVHIGRKVCVQIENTLNAELHDLTGGVIETAGQVAALREWIAKTADITIPDLKADTVTELLPQVEGKAKRALEIRQTLSKASTKKLIALDAWADPDDDRIRGMLQYHGASTGRWAGRGPQPQNFPRPTLKIDQETLLADLRRGDADYLEMVYGSAPLAVAEALRGMFIADEGKDFLAGDLAQIEARVLAWFGQEQWKLDAFKAYDEGDGDHVYCVAAEAVFGRRISKEDDPLEYQIGKILELASGFQGWIGAWRGFDSSDNHSDEDIAGYMGTWRKKHPGVKDFWKTLEAAAMLLVLHGECSEVNGVEFGYEPHYMFIKLPSGRKLWYRDPHVVEVQDRFHPERTRLQVCYWTWQQGRWQRVYAYGGLWCENIVQATARDILVGGMYRIEEHNHPIVLTIHDEALTEPKSGCGDEKLVGELLTVPVDYMPGLPLAADVWTGPRYKK